MVWRIQLVRWAAPPAGLIKYLNLPAIFPAKARYRTALPMESITARLNKMQF